MLPPRAFWASLDYTRLRVPMGEESGRPRSRTDWQGTADISARPFRGHLGSPIPGTTPEAAAWGGSRSERR